MLDTLFCSRGVNQRLLNPLGRLFQVCSDPSAPDSNLQQPAVPVARHLEALFCVFERLPCSALSSCGKTAPVYSFTWMLIGDDAARELSAGVVCRTWNAVVKRVYCAASKAYLVIKSSSDARAAIATMRIATSLRDVHLVMHCVLDDASLEQFAGLCACPLERLEISFSSPHLNKLTGRGLGSLTRTLSRSLNCLMVNSCRNLTELVISSPVLETLHIESACSLQRILLECPAMKTLSLDLTATNAPPALLQPMIDQFMSQTSEHVQHTTDMLKHALGGCGALSVLHVSAPFLTDGGIRAMLSSDASGLRQLSFTHCPLVTDQGVEIIALRCNELMTLDVSGCTLVGDASVRAVADAFSETLVGLHVAACPRVTSSALTYALQTLHELRILDAGHCMQLEMPKTLTVEHSRLEVLSLWGCSSLREMAISCPSLQGISLHGCSGLVPGSVQVGCPNLKHSDTEGCNDAVRVTVSSNAKRFKAEPK